MNAKQNIGFCDQKFQNVLEKFSNNLESSEEIGASFAVYQNNKLLINLHGGFRNKEKTLPWDIDTIVNIHSSQQNNWSSQQKDVFQISPTNHFSIMIDVFCKEIMGIKSANYNFEEDLLNQARIMEAHRLSNKENRFVNLSEIPA